MKKIFIIGVAILCFGANVFAGKLGENAMGVYYVKNDMALATSEWITDDLDGDGVQEYYYFNDCSILLKGTVTDDGNEVNDKGQLIENGVVKVVENTNWLHKDLGNGIVYSINDIDKLKLISECTTLDECPTIKFGKYEQDNNFSNGKEDLEWIVLDRQDGKALITTKYIVDCKCYNDERKDITWENCTLRSWLNNSFYNTAFSDADKKKIIGTMIENRDNTKYGTKGGNDTMDNVFCLSLDEANRYFGSDNKDGDNKLRATKGTEYAKKVDNQGYKLWVSDSSDWYGGSSDFWLRSPGKFQYCATCVINGGYVYVGGNTVAYPHDGVRPALWIKY